MGYTTDFSGALVIEPQLKPEHLAYLQAFNQIRHMTLNSARVINAESLGEFSDPVRRAAGLPVGKHGCYVIGFPHAGFQAWGPEADEYAKAHNLNTFGGIGNSEHLDAFVTDRNGGRFFTDEPSATPGIWCQWTVSTDITGKSRLFWDGGEKFYNYVEWLEWLIAHFFAKWGYTLNGTIEWEGEDSDDRGQIRVKDNKVTTHAAIITYED